MVANEIEIKTQHPLIPVSSSSSTETDDDVHLQPGVKYTAEIGRKKSQKHRRRGRGGRRRSSEAVIDIPKDSSNSNSNSNKEQPTAIVKESIGATLSSSMPVTSVSNSLDNTSNTTATPRRRRRRSSAASKTIANNNRKKHDVNSDADNEKYQSSLALNSLVDIISEMKRLPTKAPFIVKKEASNDNGNGHTNGNEPPLYYRRTRRYSEPPHKSTMPQSNIHFDLKITRPALTPIQEVDQKKGKSDKSSSTANFCSSSYNSRPLFTNSFMILEEEVGEEDVPEKDLVYPLSTTSIPKVGSNSSSLTIPKRSRSKSVPDAIYQLPRATSFQINHQHNNNNNHNQKGRKQVFPAHLDSSEAQKLIRARQLYAGVLKVNQQDSSEANVECQELDGASIYIFGSRNRNRALNGDEVAVELVDVDGMLYEKQFKRQVRQTRRLSLAATAANLSSSNTSSPLVTPSSFSLSISEDCNPFFADAVDEKNNEWMRLNDERRPKYCGRVVSILERPKSFSASGVLSLNRPYAAQLDNSSRVKKDSNPKIVWFIPTDKRLPLVAIPLKEAPPDFVKYHEEYKNRIFKCTIQRWPATSLHPFGTIIREIGWIGELPVHSDSLIADHHLGDTEYPEEVLEAFAAVPAEIQKADREGRRDLTIEGMNTFTCDSAEADTDYVEHAFSIKLTDDNIYEVGVHIPNIARFVPAKSPLDRELRTRGCAVHLTNKTIPFLPRSFLNSHCAFVQHREQLAYSVICRFTHKGAYLHTWIGETIIRPTQHFSKEQLYTTASGEYLLTLCRKIQQNRIQKSGGLSLAAVATNVSSSVRFNLSDSGYPDRVDRVDRHDDDEWVLLQELLLVANMEVGQKLCSKFPDQALLYRQAEPYFSTNPLMTLVQDYFDNVPLTSSLQGLFQLIEETETSLEKQKTLRYLIRQCIPDSQYYSAGAVDITKFCHSTFGASIYTVFTEPFYNYASIQVQRQLTMALRGAGIRGSSGFVDENQRCAKTNLDENDEDTVRIARRCNSAQALQLAAEQSDRKLYTAAFIYRQCLDRSVRWIPLKAFVIGLGTHKVEIYIPEYDLALPADLIRSDSVTSDNSSCDETEEAEQRYEYEYDSVLNTMKITRLNSQSLQQQEKDTVETIYLEFLSSVQVYVHVDLKSIKPVITVRFFEPPEVCMN